MKKVFVHLATGFEDVEAISIIDVLRRAEIDVTTVSINEDKTVLSAHNVPVIADKLFTEVDYNEADMIVLPGGLPGATNLDEHEGLKAQIKAFDEAGKGLAAICAAPMVFGHLGLLKGKEAICYPGFEEHLEGATVTDAPAVEADHIITGKGPGTALLFSLKIVEKLKGAKLAQQLKAGMLING
ncbi:DJ-1/PfpI family protein [Prolixibacteraceae bacterium JC049]|nr:DJ-1/PfpI family protein [Prolixibacteraceae bacterium JC049]